MKNILQVGYSRSATNQSAHQQPNRKGTFRHRLKQFSAQARKGLCQLHEKLSWEDAPKKKTTALAALNPANVEKSCQKLKPCLATALIELASDSPAQRVVFCGFFHCFKKFEDEGTSPLAQVRELLLNLDHPAAKVILERIKGDFGFHMETVLKAEIQAWNTEYGSSFQALYLAIIQLRKDLTKELCKKLGESSLPAIALVDCIAMEPAEIAAGRYFLNQAYIDAFDLRQS